jgi:hypothetical protein
MQLSRWLLVLLLSAGTAQAQLKPPANLDPPAQPPGAPSTPSTSSTPAEPAANPATAAKEAEAAKSASAWLKLIDSGEYGKSWDQCAPLFREKISRQQWTEGVPKNRAEVGTLKTRNVKGTAYRTSVPGAPDGEYVTVLFASEYEKNPAAEELVTLTLQAGVWRPIGYLLR